MWLVLPLPLALQDPLPDVLRAVRGVQGQGGARHALLEELGRPLGQSAAATGEQKSVGQDGETRPAVITHAVAWAALSSLAFSSAAFSSLAFSSAALSSLAFSSAAFSSLTFSSAAFSSLAFSSAAFSSAAFSSLAFSSAAFPGPTHTGAKSALPGGQRLRPLWAASASACSLVRGPAWWRWT